MARAYYNRNRRYRRYRSKTLSTRNIFSRKRASSQASQIYALRKRVSKLAAKSKPEIHIKNGTVVTHTFTNSVLADTYNIMVMPNISNGTDDDNKTGNYAKVYNHYFYATFEYYNSKTANPEPNDSYAANVRIIALQYKEPKHEGTKPSVSDVINNYAGSGAAYRLNHLAPLKDGITETFKVVRDFHFTVSESNPVRNIKLKLPRYNLRWSHTGDYNHMVFVVTVNGLSFASDVDEHVLMTSTQKLAFSDD